MKKKVKDCLWLWGQDAMSHQRSPGNMIWKLPDGNRLGPVEGAEYLGIPNIFRVVMCGSPCPPFDEESEKMKNVSRVVWSAIGDSGSKRNDHQTDLEEVLRQASLFPNITGAVLDDFFIRPQIRNGAWARLSVDDIRSMREKLHEATRKLDLYVVWYKRQLEDPIDEYLKEFDVITYWNMQTPAEHDILAHDLDRMIERTAGKRRITGCYIWNYGAGRPLSVDELKFECETFLRLLLENKTEGIIFCSNCCADIGGPATDWLRSWLREVGETEL